MKWYEKNRAIKKALNSSDEDKNENTDSFSNFFSNIDLDNDITALNDEPLNNPIDGDPLDIVNVQENENIEDSSFALPIEPVIMKEKKLSTIQKDTKIIGNIITEGNLAIYGEVKGNIDCEGSLHIYGSIDGNIKAIQIILEDCIYYGNVDCEELTLNHVNSTVHGNVTANNVTSSGKIKGNVSASNHLKLASKGAILGDIVAKTISFEEGAVVQGKIVMNQEVEIAEEREH